MKCSYCTRCWYVFYPENAGDAEIEKEHKAYCAAVSAQQDLSEKDK